MLCSTATNNLYAGSGPAWCPRFSAATFKARPGGRPSCVWARWCMRSGPRVEQARSGTTPCASRVRCSRLVRPPAGTSDRIMGWGQPPRPRPHPGPHSVRHRVRQPALLGPSPSPYFNALPNVTILTSPSLAYDQRPGAWRRRLACACGLAVPTRSPTPSYILAFQPRSLAESARAPTQCGNIETGRLIL